MDLVTIFKPTTLDYSDYGYKKPIRYTDDFLKDIANKTKAVLLNEEHTSKVIGSLSNFTYEDGELKCSVSDGVEFKGRGISPKFEFDLVEYDDYLLAVDGGLINAGLTDNPRSHIVCNSFKGENDMTEEMLKQTMDRNAKLERELAKKDNEIIEMQKKIDTIDELEESMAKIVKENEKYAENYDELINKAKAYDENVAQEKVNLINQIANGDDEMVKRLENHSLQQLKDVFDVYAKNSNPKGVSSGEITPKPQENEDKKDSIDDVKGLYKSVFGKELINEYE